MSNRAQNSLSLHNSICCVFPGTSPRRMNIYICMPSQLNTRDTEHKACYQEILKQKHRILGEKYKPQRTASPTSLAEKEDEAQRAYPDQHQPATGEAKALSRTTRAFSRQAPLSLKEGHKSSRAMRMMSELTLPCRA